MASYLSRKIIMLLIEGSFISADYNIKRTVMALKIFQTKYDYYSAFVLFYKYKLTKTFGASIFATPTIAVHTKTLLVNLIAVSIIVCLAFKCYFLNVIVVIMY